MVKLLQTDCTNANDQSKVRTLALDFMKIKKIISNFYLLIILSQRRTHFLYVGTGQIDIWHIYDHISTCDIPSQEFTATFSTKINVLQYHNVWNVNSSTLKKIRDFAPQFVILRLLLSFFIR